MAATFRVERTQGFTIMSNYHLRDKSLSLKAKGLLSYMLSLPPEWDYSERGLVSASGAGRSSVASALRELENAGYLERHRVRRENGTLEGTEYIIREHPKTPTETPSAASNSQKSTGIPSERDRANRPLPGEKKPKAENQLQVSASFTQPKAENPAQDNLLLAYKDNNKIITYPSKDLSIHPSELKAYIEDQIDYAELAEEYGEGRMEGIVLLMEDVATDQSEEISVGQSQYPAEVVKERFESLEREHIEYVLDSMSALDKPVRNIRAYLLAALFNAPATLDEHFLNRVNVDLGPVRKPETPP